MEVNWQIIVRKLLDLVLNTPANFFSLKDTRTSLQGAFKNKNEDKTVSYQQIRSFKYFRIKSGNKSDLEWRTLMTCQLS